MAITADFHLHSSFSGDSNCPMEHMIEKGLQLGLSHMCFTEHNDFDYPVSQEIPSNFFTLNTDAYLYELLKNKKKYKDHINILFGVELGLQPHIAKQNMVYSQSYDFDFIIGSSHLCNGKDPYYKDFYQNRSEEEAYYEYFASIQNNIKSFTNFDIFGHLDYVVRYGPNKDANYTYESYQDIIDEILKLLLEKGKGIEINTGGLDKGLRDLHPLSAIIRRYKKLGGEIITIGSDSHDNNRITSRFDYVCEVLKESGFSYYTIFEKRIPSFIKF